MEGLTICINQTVPVKDVIPNICWRLADLSKMPYMVIGEKKGTCELLFTNLLIHFYPTYTFIKKFGNTYNKVKRVTLFFDTKKESGWIEMDKKEAWRMYKALEDVFDSESFDLNAGIATAPITKPMRYS